MNAFDILVQEHDVVRLVLDCLEVVIRRARQAKDLDVDLAEKVVAFARGYVDSCHHAKEENYLFPLLCDRAQDQMAEPISCMLREHEMGRRHVRAMVDKLDVTNDGVHDTREYFCLEAGAYIALLRSHIQKENIY